MFRLYVWLAVDDFLFSTWETTFQGALSCPHLTGIATEKAERPPSLFLTISFMLLPHCLSLRLSSGLSNTTCQSVLLKLTGFQSAPLNREIYMFSLSISTPSPPCFFFSLSFPSLYLPNTHSHTHLQINTVTLLKLHLSHSHCRSVCLSLCVTQMTSSLSWGNSFLWLRGQQQQEWSLLFPLLLSPSCAAGNHNFLFLSQMFLFLTHILNLAYFQAFDFFSLRRK